MRLRTRNSRTRPKSGENRDPNTRIAEAAPLIRIARRARKAAASEESGQDLVAQTRVRGDQSPERITRNGDHFAGLGNPGRNEHTLAGQEIQLAKAELQESATRIAKSGAKIGTAVVLALPGIMAITAAVVIGLGILIDSYWVSSLIVGVIILAVLSVVAVVIGARQFGRAIA